MKMLKTLIRMIVYLTFISAVTEALISDNGGGRFAKWLISLVRLAAVALPIMEMLA